MKKLPHGAKKWDPPYRKKTGSIASIREYDASFEHRGITWLRVINKHSEDEYWHADIPGVSMVAANYKAQPNWNEDYYGFQDHLDKLISEHLLIVKQGCLEELQKAQNRVIQFQRKYDRVSRHLDAYYQDKIKDLEVELEGAYSQADGG